MTIPKRRRIDMIIVCPNPKLADQLERRIVGTSFFVGRGQCCPVRLVVVSTSHEMEDVLHDHPEIMLAAIIHEKGSAKVKKPFTLYVEAFWRL